MTLTVDMPAWLAVLLGLVVSQSFSHSLAKPRLSRSRLETTAREVTLDEIASMLASKRPRARKEQAS